MSSIRGLSHPRSDRTPFRDVQNELHEMVPNIKHKDVSEEKSNSMPAVCSDGQTVKVIDEHQDVTLKSFVCLEGEVLVEDEHVMSNESILIKRLAMENNQPPETDLNETNEVECTNDNQTNEEHIEHPYSHESRFCGSDQKEEVSTCEMGNVTLLCLGGEVQISDGSVNTDESILASGNHLQCPGTNAHISKRCTDVLSVHCQPMDHSYCNLQSHVSSNEDNSQSTANAMSYTSQSTDENVTTDSKTTNTANLNNHEHADPCEKCSDIRSTRQGEITFKSFCCSGVEIEIADLTKVSEMSLCMENPAELQSQCCLNDISEDDGHSIAVWTTGSKHIDHIYCNIEENVDLSKEKSEVHNVTSTEIEVCTKSQIISASLTENSGNTIHGKIRDKSGSVMCCEMETETSLVSQQTSQHLSTLSHCENEIRSSEVVQLDTEQSISGNKHKVSNDDILVVEKHPDQHLQAFSHAKEKEVLSCQDTFFENTDLETSNVKDNALSLKAEEILPEIEVMRLCDQSGEAVSVPQDNASAIALISSCTPKTSTVSRSVLHDTMLSHLWPELPESPLPPPQFNSTTLANAFSYTPTPVKPPQEKDLEVKVASGQDQKVSIDPPVLSNGPLQEQLRQMAELLMLASGKVVGPAPVNCCSASVGTSPVEKRNVSVCRTPVQRMEKSINTSAVVEIVNEVNLSDASTITDSLLWKWTSGNLEHLSRSEVEQRLTSTLIMVEVLSQQLASARGYNPSQETSPSDLRDKLIQTDHTELRQNGTYKDLYVIAQEKIQSLEHDQEILQTLYNSIQEMRVGMNSVKTCTEDAIFTMKQIGDIVHVDQETLSEQVRQMKSLYRRYRETLQRMKEKMTDMRQHMENALEEKEAAFSVTQQLRGYHAAQVAKLEHSVGSHQELMSALQLAYPSLIELSKSYTESISAANVHLRRKHEDHASLLEELRKAQELIQRTSPVLHKLHQRAMNAMEQSKQHLAMRDRAVEERDLMENELMQLRSSLQDASEQIADLNMQQTIMTSEMSVLREQLSQAEEERSQLQRTNIELSVTVTSTLASYTFLEQTLASETSKSQQAMHESHQATDRVNCLEAALESSRKQILDYEAVLSQRETLIQKLHAEAEIQHYQLRKLDQLQTELSSAKEMTEFLQAENELAREQMEESERLLCCHLQGLRERNLECEDLKLALEQLRFEKDSLQEELESTREKARHMLLEQGEKMAQASNDVIHLNHRVCCISNTIKESLSKEESESSDKIVQSHRHPSGSFVDSIMVAMMKTQDPEKEHSVGSEESEVQQDSIGSEISAFTRIPSTAHTEVKEERRSCVLELLSDFGETISDLQFTIDQLRVQKDSEQQALRQTICRLQEAQQEASQRDTMEISELRQNVDKLQTRVEKDAAALQQKAQDERSLRKLCSELEENMEAAQKYRAENSELRREVADLRRSLQQAQVEAHVLREELKQTGFQSATSTTALDERIKLLREVEKLKANLMETEENRAKVLERAKRHQRVHAMNQSKLERELHMLDDMIETVRRTLSSIPDLVKSCPELQKLVEFLG